MRCGDADCGGGEENNCPCRYWDHFKDKEGNMSYESASAALIDFLYKECEYSASMGIAINSFKINISQGETPKMSLALAKESVTEGI